MRVLRFPSFVFASILLVLSLPLSAQQTPSATKDPQAVSILTQALAWPGESQRSQQSPTTPQPAR
jgi:hypothetical protein